MASSQSAWGIDVGTTAIKAIKLRREGTQVFLEAMEVIPHSRFLSEPDVDRREIVRESLTHFLERYPMRGERVFVGAPGSTSFSRFVKLPPVEVRKIPEIVRFEAIQQIPFPLDQVNWDYHSFRNPDSPDVEIGIFAIKADVVSTILADFQSLGIAVHGLQLAPLAVYNAVTFEGKGADKGTIFLDIGADHSDMIVVDQGRVWLRNINLGGNSFTESLAKSFRFTFEKAEDLKRTAVTSKYARQIFQAMRPTFADLVAEIQRSIGFYNASHRESRVEQIVGMGNLFRLSNLQKYLQQYLGMEVARLDGFAKIEVADAKMAAGLSDQALGMGVAYGLALQGVGLATIDTNLLPTAIARQMVWRKKYPWFAATAALFVLGTAAAAARYSMDSSAFRASINTTELQQAKRQIAAEAALHNQYDSISNTYKSNVAKISYYLNLGQKRQLWPRIIQTLYQSLPQAMKKKPTDVKDASDWKIVIQSVASSYHASLSGQTGGGTNTSSSPMASRRGALAGPGFQLVISGYTPYRNWGQILQVFQDRLGKLGGSAAKKPFVMVIVKGSLQFERIGDLESGGGGQNSGTLGFVPWGSQLGPFADEFLPRFLPKQSGTTIPVRRSHPNFQQENNFSGFSRGAGPFGAGGLIAGNGNSRKIHGAINPDSGKSLNNATAFQMVVNVYVH